MLLRHIVHGNTFYSHLFFWSSQVSSCLQMSFHCIYLHFSQHFLESKQLKWWIDSNKTGGEQQASISVWRRGVFTELPSLHLASPLLQIRQTITVACLLGLAVQILVAAIVSDSTPSWKHKTGIHACGHLLISLSYLFGISFSSSSLLLCLCVWDWPLRFSVWQRVCDWSSLCAHCAKAIQMPVMPAGHACCVCMSVQCLCGFMSLHVHVCVAELCFFSFPWGTPCCDPASVTQCDASCCCWPKTLHLCVCTLMDLNWDWTS